MVKTRERYVKTIRFGNPDKIPLNPGVPRESTLRVWREQGLPEGLDYMDTVLKILGIKKEAELKWHFLNVSFKMDPEFETQILEHKDGHYVILDWMGAVTEIADTFDESYLRSAKDFVTRKWHKFPVATSEDWENMKSRFDSSAPGRIGENLRKIGEEEKTKGKILTISFNGVFWQLREWCGFENLCILMAEDPDFVNEMAEFWGDFVLEMLRKVLRVIVPDRVLISEDMAFKAHSMISPAMTREYIVPQYNKWIPLIKNWGCPVVELDSDGFIEELIPVWIEAGVNCCSPVEFAAQCDILNFRNKFGRKMAYMQGIDKRLIARGDKELEDHVMKIVPALYKVGGYIPGCDHGVPPDISWKNYIEFTRMLAKLSGWL